MNGIPLMKVLPFSAVILGLAGFLIGMFFFRNLMSGVAVMGVLAGSVVGIVAAIACLVINRRYCVGAVSLVFNLTLFIIVAREMQIIG